MKVALKLFFLPGDFAADLLGATKADDRTIIRTLVDMLFWNIVIIIGAWMLFSVTAPYDEVTEATIRALVDGFYARVRRDPALGPVFARAIADDAWPAHLQKMYAFWSSVMLTSGRYKGDPVSAHRRIAGVAPPLFGNWLDLFEATAADLFVPAIAERFAHTARRIAESLKLALFFRPDRPWADDLRRRPPLAGTGA